MWPFRILTLLITLLAQTALADDPLKIGFVYIGPVGDLGWTYQHDQGRLAVEAEFGAAVETIFQESVPEGADAERAMTQMALAGADLIFATSFGYMDQVISVAQKFPEVKFEHATGYKRADNVSTYSGRFYEGRAIQGLIAGKMTKTNIIGYIASYPIPEVIRGINAAFLHARDVNPDVEFKIIWVNTWFNPSVEADAATALLDQGADIILQATDSTAAMNIAEERGVFAFGQASDMLEAGPNARLSSIIDNWSLYYVDRVGAVLDGSWESKDTWDGIGPGLTEIGGFNDQIPFHLRKEAMDLAVAIASGRHHPFTGPIKRQDGSQWLAEGEVAADGDLLGMDFFVEGLAGSVPQ